MIPDDPFVFRARVDRVIDGDTIDVQVDLGFHLVERVRLRLIGINTPELHDDNPEVRSAAVKARSFVEGWSARLDPADPWPIRIRTSKDDSFGRWLAEVEAVGSEVSLNEGLLEAGLAVVYSRRR